MAINRQRLPEVNNSRFAGQTSTDELKDLLFCGAEKMDLRLSEAQGQQLIHYLQLFAKWNAAYNLSAVRDIREMVSRHLLDSLSIVPLVANSAGGEHWLDVGSGGGLPGIPLAIMFPDKRLTLLDSNGKKTRFLFQVKTELQLSRVEVVQERIERFEPPAKFDAVFSRAFASIKDFLEGCSHLVEPGARFFAMKGLYPHDELSEVTKPFNVEHCYPLSVPGETAARHLVVIRYSNHD
ncbi:16S rRNA (guanine(527)-N(7))-methyltransferase RsmG [Proteobacteria bacterium 005FR1]|nr:16S rRNA (guanine(527)-N(7))-methyltransferase RsmG [Proteobacteria bacterium 005FR1]